MSKSGYAVIVAILVVAGEFLPAIPAGGSAPAPSQQQMWMPDVAERIASLRERTESATEESKARSAQETQQGQWWHRIAIAPRDFDRRVGRDHGDRRP